MKITNLLLFFLFTSTTFATVPTQPLVVKSIFDELQYSELTEVKLAVDLTAITSNIRSDEKHKATFTYPAENGESVSWDIKVKLRGKFRRMKCNDTPPLKLFFDKTDLENAGLAKFNDLKLVNYCGQDPEEARELLLKEYMTYKMYNELTDASFRVQLINITYQDTGSDREIEQLAFLIEDTAQLRARLNAKKYKAKEEVAARPDFDREQTRVMGLFQYMIGNADWQLDFEKNTKYIVTDGKLQVIPYDFDFSGMVNPSYGRANSNYGLTSLTQRVYLGTEEDLIAIKPAIKLFRSKRKALINLVKNNEHLQRKSRKEMIAYLNSFYDTLDVASLRAAMPSTEGAAVK